MRSRLRLHWGWTPLDDKEGGFEGQRGRLGWAGHGALPVSLGCAQRSRARWGGQVGRAGELGRNTRLPITGPAP